MKVFLNNSNVIDEEDSIDLDEDSRIISEDNETENRKPKICNSSLLDEERKLKSKVKD